MKLNLIAGAMTALIVATISGCSVPPSAKKDSTVAGSTTNAEDLSKLGDADLRAQVQKLLLEAKTQESVRSGICSELQNIRNLAECQGLSRLTEDSQVISCLSSGSITRSLKSEFEVIASSGAAVRLSVNDGEFTSSPFSANGQKQKITWSNPASLNKLSPRLVDLTNLAVVDAANQSVSLAQLTLLINGRDLGVHPSSGGTSIDINTFKNAFNGSQCRRSQSDVDALKQSAVASVVLDQSEKDKINIMSRAELLQTSDGNKTRRDIANSQILAVEKEMVADQDRGCWLDKSLETLEITVRGAMTNPTSCAAGATETAVPNFDYQMSLEVAGVKLTRAAAGNFGKPTLFGTQLAGKKIRNIGQIKIGIDAASTPCTVFYVSGLDLKLGGQIIASYDGPQLSFSGNNAGILSPWFDASTTAAFNTVKNLGGCH